MSRRFRSAFTIIELLIVMSIILVLAGLILATSSYVQKKGQRSRAEAEIAALSAALESYKADNGMYAGAGSIKPAAASDTDALNAQSDTNAAATPAPNKYMKATLLLYKELSGDSDGNGSIQSTESGKQYFSFRPQMLGGAKDSSGNLTAVTYIRDPFGNSYGYSTANYYDATTGYNPTFDLWSTANSTTAAEWIKNW